MMESVSHATFVTSAMRRHVMLTIHPFAASFSDFKFSNFPTLALHKFCTVSDAASAVCRNAL